MTPQKIRQLCKTLETLVEGRPDTAEILDLLKNIPMWAESNRMMSALEATGVDNWDGFEKAQEIYDTL